MSKAERVFIVSTLFGIALHTVASDTPQWIRVPYAVVMFLGALYTIAGISGKLPPDGPR